MPLYSADFLTVAGDSKSFLLVACYDSLDHCLIDQTSRLASTCNQGIDIRPALRIQLQTNGVWFVAKYVAEVFANFVELRMVCDYGGKRAIAL
jgi:hypothetical protein